MRLHARLLLGLAASLPLLAGAQVPRRPVHPLADSVWLRGAEWEVVPIVNLDSSKSKDPMAVRQVRRVYVLAPGHVVYEAKLTSGGDWAVFSWVNGVTKRLAVSGEDFLEPDGVKKRITLQRFFFDGGAKWYIVPAAVDRRLPVPNGMYLTDGTAWQKLVRDNDTVSVGGAPMVVANARGLFIEDDGGIVLNMDFSAPSVSGIVRWRDGRFERLLMGDESLPGAGAFSPTYGLYQTFGMWSGLRKYETTGSRALALVRSHLGGRTYQEHVIVLSGAERRLMLSTDTLTMRHAGDSVVSASLSPRGDVLLQRGGTIGVVGPDTPWRALLDMTQIGQPKFALGEVAWLDDSSSRGILPVWPMQTSGTSVLVAFEPLLFYFDGTAAIPLQKAGAVPGMFTSVGVRDVVRRVPGYQQGIVVYDRFFAGAKATATVFDAERRALFPAPVIRTRGGDVGLQHLVGWNSEREAVMWQGGVFLLRRPPQ